MLDRRYAYLSKGATPDGLMGVRMLSRIGMHHKGFQNKGQGWVDTQMSMSQNARVRTCSLSEILVLLMNFSAFLTLTDSEKCSFFGLIGGER